MINFAIGTAQFGQDYGINNKTGAVTGDTAKQITRLALENGINVFDTAKLYGESETVLGNSLPENSSATIITKLYASEGNPEQLLKDWEDSRNKLQNNDINTVLIHNADALLSAQGDKIWKNLETLKSDHAVTKIGVSLYTPEDFLTLSNRYSLDIIQIPCNMLDQRFLSDDVQELKTAKSIEFHARSLFLQGLLLSEIQDLPDQLQKHQNAFVPTNTYAAKHDLSRLELCLLFANWAQENNMIDRWVIGIDTPDQLIDITNAAKNIDKHPPLTSETIKTFASNDMNVIDPRSWKR